MRKKPRRSSRIECLTPRKAFGLHRQRAAVVSLRACCDARASRGSTGFGGTHAAPLITGILLALLARRRKRSVHSELFTTEIGGRGRDFIGEIEAARRVQSHRGFIATGHPQPDSRRLMARRPLENCLDQSSTHPVSPCCECGPHRHQFHLAPKSRQVGTSDAD